MKRLLAMLVIALMLWTVGLAPAEAAIPDDVQKLLDTKKCQVCILNDAELSNTDLHGANLKIAVLTGANLAGADLMEARLFYGDVATATPRTRTGIPDYVTGANTGAVVEGAGSASDGCGSCSLALVLMFLAAGSAFAEFAARPFQH